MKKIDLEHWERRSHYEWFSSFADPSVSMDVKMDLTALLSDCKREGVSSFAAVMYLVCKSVNANRAFRLRISGQDVVEIPFANVAYTIMVNDSRFVNCRARTQGFGVFLEDVERNRREFENSNFVQKQYNNVSVIDDIYCSCVPWVNFTSVRQPIPDRSPESKSIPRVCWGRYFREGERTYTTLNVTANHALVDGIDLAKVFEGAQTLFDGGKNSLV